MLFSRQIFLTALIVGGVYSAVLLLNRGHLPNERVTWSDSGADISLTTTDWNGRTGALGPAKLTTDDRNADAHSFALERSVAEGVSAGSANPSSASASTDEVWPPAPLVGVSSIVSFGNAGHAQAQVLALWQQFAGRDDLHEQLDWSDGEQIVYAYYDDFSPQLDRARLTIGYSLPLSAADETSVCVPSGATKRYVFSDSGSLPERVWVDAYPDGAILERYRISEGGDYHPLDGFVVKPRTE